MKKIKPLNPGQKKAVMAALMAAKQSGAAPPGAAPPGAGAPPPMAPPMPPGPPRPGMKRGGRAHTFARGGPMPEHEAPYDAPFKKSNRKFAGGGTIERLGEPQSFKSAFREARSSGADTFTWHGKKYTTELAKPSSPGIRFDARGEDARDFQAQAAKEKADRYPVSQSEAMARNAKPVSDYKDEPSDTFKKGGRIAYKKGGKIEGSAAEEAAESPAFEKKEGKKGEAAERFKPKKYAGGGSVVCSTGGRIGGKGDGCITRGRTKGTMR